MARIRQASEGACLGDEVMAGFLESSLTQAEQEHATQHLSQCQECREQFAALARLEDEERESYRSLVFDESGEALRSAANDAAELEVGTSLGRYVLLGILGKGGMGIVYSAFDPELDRRIAVKVIRSDAASTSEEAKKQLREEARAMAKLTHPNVVRVYDVGRQGGLVYIAMEYVEGVDLGRFAARHSDDWRTVFAACVQAGRGLIAAHDAGLVHRDFKPSNVLCATDGRVLVADFGLTRLLRPSTGGAAAAATRGAGTPGYVAPEQASGQESSPKSDQYSFCVTVAQCVLGRAPRAEGYERPDDEESTQVSEEFLSRSEDTPARPTRSTALERGSTAAAGPKRLQPILRKGMSRQPEKRHESMALLLGRLQHVANRGRRMRVVGAIAGGAGALGLLMFFVGSQTSKPAEPCANSDLPVRQVWNKAREAALSNKLAASPYQSHASHFLGSLQRVASGLSREHESACKATLVSQTQSADFYDRQVLCMGSQLTSLDAILESVEGGGSVEAAQSTLSKFASPEDCRPSDSALNTPPPPRSAQERQAMSEVDRVLAESTLLARQDKSSESLERVTRAVGMAKEIGYAPLLAKVYLAHSELLSGLENFAEARKAAENARDAAAESRDTVNVIRALGVLAEDAARHEDDPSKAYAYIDTARSLALGTAIPAYREASLARSAAVVANAAKDAERALAETARGLAKLDAAQAKGTPQGLELRESLRSLTAAAHFNAGRYTEALEEYKKITEIKARRLGRTHSGMSSTIANLATVQYKVGAYAEARASLAWAYETLESPDASRSVLSRCLNLDGLILNRLMQTDEAIATYRRAIEVQTEVYGPDHRMVWATKSNLANVLVEKEAWGEAIALQEAQLAWAKTRDNSESAVIKAKINLANTISLGGETEEELARAKTYIDEVLAALPKTDRARINALSVRGQTLYRIGDNRASASAYREAIALADASEHVRRSLRAYLASKLAESLWKARDSRAALAAAREAAELYTGIEGKEAALAEVKAWIAERAP